MLLASTYTVISAAFFFASSHEPLGLGVGVPESRQAQSPKSIHAAKAAHNSFFILFLLIFLFFHRSEQHSVDKEPLQERINDDDR